MRTQNVNLLLHAVNIPRQAGPASWLKRTRVKPADIGNAWIALFGFIRLAPHDILT